MLEFVFEAVVQILVANFVLDEYLEHFSVMSFVLGYSSAKLLISSFSKGTSLLCVLQQSSIGQTNTSSLFKTEKHFFTLHNN